MSDTVITEKDGRIFRASGTVIIKDGREIGFEPMVPVLAGNGERLGFANLSEDEGRIVADIHLDYYVPERLDLQTSDKLYLNPFLASCFEQATGEPFGAPTVTQLELTPYLCSDKRIKPVQLVES